MFTVIPAQAPRFLFLRRGQHRGAIQEGEVETFLLLAPGFPIAFGFGNDKKRS